MINDQYACCIGNLLPSYFQFVCIFPIIYIHAPYTVVMCEL